MITNKKHNIITKHKAIDIINHNKNKNDIYFGIVRPHNFIPRLLASKLIFVLMLFASKSIY